MKREDIVILIGIASLIGSAYVMKLVTTLNKKVDGNKGTKSGTSVPEWYEGDSQPVIYDKDGIFQGKHGEVSEWKDIYDAATK